MNRRLAALVLAVVAPLGLAACSSPGTATSTPPAGAASAPPTATDAGAAEAEEQSLAEACDLVTTAITTAGSEIASFDMSAAVSDPGAAVDAYLTMADSLSGATAKITNAQVSSAAAAVSQSFTALTDGLSKAFLEKDPAAMAGFPALQAAASKSMAAFTNLCQGS